MWLWVSLAALTASAVTAVLPVGGRRPLRTEPPARQPAAAAPATTAETVVASPARRARDEAASPPPEAVRVFDETAAQFDQALRASGAYAVFAACDRAGREDCDDAWSQAVFFTSSQGFEGEEARSRAEALLAEHGRSGLEHAVRFMLASSDPVERIATLVLLRASPKLEEVRVPPEAYERLRDRSLAEAVLVLKRAGALPDSSTADEVEGLAMDAALDPRIRKTAAQRLAFGGERRRLAAVLEAWLDPAGELPVDDTGLVTSFLLQCDAACEPLLARLATDPRLEVRALLPDPQ